MKLQFDQIPASVTPHFKGGEGSFQAHMYADEGAKMMKAVLTPGSSVGIHTHEDSSEMIYVLSGSGRMLIDGGEERLGPGDFHYCPKGHTHSFVNDGAEDLVFIAVVPFQ